MAPLSSRRLHSIPSAAGDGDPLWLRIAEAAGREPSAAPQATLRLFTALLDFMPDDDPRTLYYLGQAYFAAGGMDAAASFLEFSLKHGLQGHLRGLAYLQLASSLRRIDRVAEALEWLDAGERDRGVREFCDDLVAFRIVILHDTGQDAAAVHVAVHHLSPHLGSVVPDLLP